MTVLRKDDLVKTPQTQRGDSEYALVTGETRRTHIHEDQDCALRVEYASGEHDWFPADDLTLVSRPGRLVPVEDREALKEGEPVLVRMFRTNETRYQLRTFGEDNDWKFMKFVDVPTADLFRLVEGAEPDISKTVQALRGACESAKERALDKSLEAQVVIETTGRVLSALDALSTATHSTESLWGDLSKFAEQVRAIQVIAEEE